MLEFISNIIQWLTDTLFSPVQTAFQNAWNNVKDIPLDVIPDSNLKSFVGAFISTFIPIPSIIACIGIVMPFKLANFVMAVVLRVKSFLPFMGD